MRTLGCLLVLLAGCDLYQHQEPGEPQCDKVMVPAIQSRNVETGACEVQGGFEVLCGFDYADLPACAGPCTGLDEAHCIAGAGCHAAFRNGQFSACWETVDALHDGSCPGLDALTCADHDNCVSLLAAGTYDRCIAEPRGPCSVNTDCHI